MALIQCPECDKTVSSLAEICPNCGFSVAQHFKTIENDKREKEDRTRTEQNKAKTYSDRVNNVEPPPKPEFPTDQMIKASLFFVVSFAVAYGVYITASKAIGSIAFDIVAIVLALGFIIWFAKFVLYDGIYLNHKQRLSDYKWAMGHFAEYRAKVIQEEDEINAELESAARKKVEHLVPRCISCGSLNVKKISGGNKVASAAVFGLFAIGHIGKTYKCQNCGMKFI